MKRFSALLRKEEIGGVLLLLAAVAAMVWANAASSSYQSAQNFELGPESLHLRLSSLVWASDGLLAVFFFNIGLELKREFVAGELPRPVGRHLYR